MSTLVGRVSASPTGRVAPVIQKEFVGQTDIHKKQKAKLCKNYPSPMAFLESLRQSNEPYRLPTSPPLIFRESFLRMMTETKIPSHLLSYGTSEKITNAFYEAIVADNLPAMKKLSSLHPECASASFYSNPLFPPTIAVACILNATKIATFLLEDDPRIANKISGPIGATPAFFAAAADSLECLQLLLVEQDVAVDFKNKDGSNFFHSACESGNDKIVKFLVEFCIAKGEEGVAMLKTLLLGKNNIELSPLQTAVVYNNLSCVEALQSALSHDASVSELFESMVNQKTIVGFTALHLACMSIGCCDAIITSKIAALLICSGANVNNQDNQQRVSPLHLACATNSSVVVSLLLNLGASANCLDNFGYTPVHVCCINGNSACVMLCASCSSDLAIRDNKGRTPVYIAAESNFESTLQLLLTMAPPEVVNQVCGEGHSPLMAACKKSADRCVEILLNAGAKLILDDDNIDKKLPIEKAADAALVNAYFSDQKDIVERATNVVRLVSTAVPSRSSSPSSASPSRIEENGHAKKYKSDEVNKSDGKSPRVRRVTNEENDNIKLKKEMGYPAAMPIKKRIRFS